MKVYLVRHGQTNYNDLGLCNADPSVDVHLTEQGIQQANELADKMKDLQIDEIFISELRRTKQTADIINKYHDAHISVDNRLNDNRTGFEGKTVDEYYAALNAADDKWTVRFNDGESLNDTKDRVADFIKDLLLKSYKSCVIVTSMSIVQAFYGLITHLTNEQAWEFVVDKGSSTELELK